MMDPVQEPGFYPDVAKLIAELLIDNWDRPIGHVPAISYKPEQYMVSANFGAVYVYALNTNPQITTVDYRTVQMNPQVGIKVSCRFRENHEEICSEIYRILMLYRRAGIHRLDGFSYIQIISERRSNDMSGWYMTTIDIQLISYATPIESAGFGPEVEKKLRAPCDCL